MTTAATLAPRLGVSAAVEERAPAAPAQVSSPADANAVAAFEAQFKKTFADIREAMQHPDNWPALGKRDDFKQFSLRMRFHVLAARHQDAAPIHHAMLAAACKGTGLSTPEFEQLATVPTKHFHNGEWLPMSARLERMADDAISTPSDDRLTRWGDELCTRHLPGMVKIPMKWAKPLAYVASHGVLPAIEFVGEPTGRALEFTADWLDAQGNERRTEAQKTFKEMKDALGTVKMSSRRLKKHNDTEKKMILMTAGVLSQAAGDCQKWMDLLSNPDKLKDPEAVSGVTKVVRTGLDAFASIFHQAASGTKKFTHTEDNRLFSVRLEGTIGAKVGSGFTSVVTKFGFAVTFPSLKEIEDCAHPSLKIETCFTPFKSWGGYGEGTGRGFKYTVGGMGSVREANFSRAVNFKTPTGGIAFQTDEALGPGVEYGASLPIGVPGVFTILPGFEVAMFHPGFEAWEKPVDWLANKLGNATEAVCDAGIAAGKAIWRGVRGKEMKDADAPGFERLGRARRGIRHATVALSAARAYKDKIAERLNGTGPVFNETYTNAEGKTLPNEAYQEMRKGFTNEEALAVIAEFLDNCDHRLESELAALRELVDQPATTPGQERSLRSKIRGAAEKVRDAEKTFAMGDILISQLLGEVHWKASGPFADILRPKDVSPEQRAELFADHVDMAMSYGAFDWIVTSGETHSSFEHLAELDADTLTLTLDQLHPKTIKRLIKHATAEDRETFPDVFASLSARRAM